MDAAIKNPTGRKYPAFTTNELRATVAESDEDRAKRYRSPLSAETRAAMIEEIKRRDAGESKTLHDILNG